MVVSDASWLVTLHPFVCPAHESLKSVHLRSRLPVDAQFCPGYCAYFLFWALGPFVMNFKFGPRTLSVYLLCWVFESFCFSYLFRVYFVSNRYLSCCVVSYRAMFLYLFTLKVILFIWLCFVINCVFINHVVFVSLFKYCVSYFNFTLCLFMTCLSKISLVFKCCHVFNYVFVFFKFCFMFRFLFMLCFVLFCT